MNTGNPAPPAAGGFRIENWSVYPALNQLSHTDGDKHIHPKAMEVLVLLAERAGDVISRDEFLDAVWGETFVSDQVLANAIWELRRAFGDAPRSPRFIATVPKRGYRLLPPVDRLNGDESPPRDVSSTDEDAPDSSPKSPDDATATTAIARSSRPQPTAAPRDTARADDIAEPGADVAGARSRSARILLAGVAVGALAAIAFFFRGLSTAPATPEEALVVAIVPFENSTGDPGLDWLVDAIPDVLTHELSSSRHLYVLDAFGPSAGGRLGSPADAAEKARRRGAHVLVSGRVTGDARALRVYGRYAPPGGEAAHFDVFASEPATLFEALADRLRLALEVEAADGDATAIAATGTTSVDAYRHYIQALALARGQDQSGGLVELHAAIGADPDFALAHGKLAHLYDVQGEVALALEAIDRALELAEERPQAERVGFLRLRARITGDIDQELEYLRQAVALRPRDASWLGTLAWFQFTHFRQCEEASVRYRQALEFDPRPDLYGYLAEAEMACGRPAEALGALERALELQGDNAETWRFYARLQSLAGDRDGAFGSIEKALGLAPDRASVIFTRALLLFEAHRFKDALAALRRHRGLVSGVNPERAGWVTEAELLRRTGDLDGAAFAAEQALGLGFAPAAAWIAGLVALDTGRTDDAARHLQALKDHFDRGESRYRIEYLEHLRGEFLKHRGETRRAAEAFALAVEARPLEQSEFRLSLARAWLDADDPEEAAGVLYRLLEIQPNHAEGHCLSADAHARAGRSEAARLEKEACDTLLAALGDGA
ncbi:MAG: winged helix-turn-helix domain-containing protein [Acidobacteriota bacterium]